MTNNNDHKKNKSHENHSNAQNEADAMNHENPTNDTTQDFDETMLTMHLFGELDDAQAADVQARLDADPEIRALYEDLQGTLGLLGPAVKAMTADADEDLRLRPDQRERVLNAAEGGETDAGESEDSAKPKAAVIPLFRPSILLYAAVMIAILAVVAAITVPNFTESQVRARISKNNTRSYVLGDEIALAEDESRREISSATEKLVGAVEYDAEIKTALNPQSGNERGRTAVANGLGGEVQENFYAYGSAATELGDDFLQTFDQDGDTDVVDGNGLPQDRLPGLSRGVAGKPLESPIRNQATATFRDVELEPGNSAGAPKEIAMAMPPQLPAMPEKSRVSVGTRLHESPSARMENVGQILEGNEWQYVWSSDAHENFNQSSAGTSSYPNTGAPDPVLGRVSPGDVWRDKGQNDSYSYNPTDGTVSRGDIQQSVVGQAAAKLDRRSLPIPTVIIADIEDNSGEKSRDLYYFAEPFAFDPADLPSGPTQSGDAATEEIALFGTALQVPPSSSPASAASPAPAGSASSPFGGSVAASGNQAAYARQNIMDDSQSLSDGQLNVGFGVNSEEVRAGRVAERDKKQLALGAPTTERSRENMMQGEAPSKAVPKSAAKSASATGFGGYAPAAAASPATVKRATVKPATPAMPATASVAPARRQPQALQELAFVTDRDALRQRYNIGSHRAPIDIPRPDPAQFGDYYEPARFDSMYFIDHGVYPIKATAKAPTSTFGLDVDTGSFTLARNYLSKGALPPRSAIRVEEFVNAVPVRYEPPTDQALNISLESAKSPFDSRVSILRVGVQGKVVVPDERPPANLTFVIDCSGSMGRENRLGLVKKSLRLLLDHLVEGDRVAIVIYKSNTQLVLEPTEIARRAEIQIAIDSLNAGGSTNLADGLLLGYDQAARHFDPNGINRVILLSDGVANVGPTGPEPILARIGEQARRGIQLTAVGFGMGNMNDALMEQLANQGDGNYAYVDRLDEARRIFVDEIEGTLMTIAKDAKIQVEFDPAQVTAYRLIGYENRALKHQDFRNDAIDAGEIGSGHTVTALYELHWADPKAFGAYEVYPSTPAVTARLRWLEPDTLEPTEIETPIMRAEMEGDFLKATPAFKATASVAEFAEILRGSVAGDVQRLDSLARLLLDISEEFAGPAPVADSGALPESEQRILDIVGMIDRARDLWPLVQRQ